MWLPGGVWTATETCFGSGARWGRLPNQQTVEGWLGNGLVNTYLNGAGITGTLPSPLFTIQRKYIRFLIGGDVLASLFRLFKGFSQKFQPIYGDFVPRWFHAPPDGRAARNARHIQGDGFQGDVSLVVYRLERGSDGSPLNMIFSRRSPI